MADRAGVEPGARTAWARLRTLGLRDWIDLGEASVTLARAHVALRWRSPAQVIARATGTPRTRPSWFTPARQQRVQWLVGVAARHVVPVPCLSRSVALARMLARRGVQTEVRVGVRTIDGQIDAHAWVEWNGRPLNDDRNHVERYLPLQPSSCHPGARASVDALSVRDALAAIVRGDDVPADVWRVTNVEAWCAAADHHGVLPLVADRIRTMASQPPDDLATAIGDRARAHAAGDLIAEVELRSVVAALDAAGVEPILFKGAHLAYVEYARPDLRPRVDTDVLIPANPSARRTAHDVLIGLGYDSPPHVGGDLVMTQRSYAKRCEGIVIHAVDVHWRVANPQLFSRVLSHDEMAGEAVAIPRIGPAARGPSALHALFMACVHRVAHHADSEHLIWLVDIDRLARRLGDHEWSRFLALMTERRVVAVCGRSLGRAADVFRTPLSSRVLDAIEEPARQGDEATAAFLKGPRVGVGAALGDVRALPSIRDRARFVREYLAPAPEYMRRVYAPGSRAPLAWLYVTRIISGARRRPRARTFPR